MPRCRYGVPFFAPSVFAFEAGAVTDAGLVPCAATGLAFGGAAGVAPMVGLGAPV